MGNRRIVELSHPISQGIVTCIGRISMVANTGTYFDSPFDRYADGLDLAGLAWSAWSTWKASSCGWPARPLGRWTPLSWHPSM